METLGQWRAPVAEDIFQVSDPGTSESESEPSEDDDDVQSAQDLADSNSSSEGDAFHLLRLHYATLLEQILDIAQSGDKSVLFTLARRLGPDGGVRPSLTGHILEEFADLFVDFPLFPPRLIPHHANGTAAYVPASMVQAAARTLPVEALAGVFPRAVACGVCASRVLGDLVTTRVLYPSKWRYFPQQVQDRLRPFLRTGFDSFIERLFEGKHRRRRARREAREKSQRERGRTEKPERELRT